MKKRNIINYAVIISAVCVFSSCGTLDNDSDSVASFDFDTFSATETTAAQSSEIVESANDTDTNISAPSDESEPISNIDSVSEQTAEPITPDSSIAEYTFEGAEGITYSYNDLYDIGLSNTNANGNYALVPDSGGAGHMYYQSYHTLNGEWVKGDMVDLPGGNSTFFALDDGRILMFSTGGAASNDFPLVELIQCNAGNIITSELPDYFNTLELYDGTSLSEHPGTEFICTYDSGYAFTFTFTDKENGTILFNEQRILDPETLRF